MSTYLNPESIQDGTIGLKKLANFTNINDSTSTSRSISLEFGKCSQIIGAALTSLSITGFTESISNRYNECLVEFDCGSNFSFTYPSSVRWANNIAPEFQNGWHYQVSFTNMVFNNTTYILGICVGFPK